MECLSPTKVAGSPKKSQTIQLNRPKHREGLYQDEDGRNVDYRDRVSDQEDIRLFTDMIFKNNVAGCTTK